MSVTTVKEADRHLTLVRDTDHDRIEELDALHGTACDMYDLATADLDQARKDLAEAARQLTAAEEAWSEAGREMDQAARAVTNAREAAGLVWTASGYQTKGTR
jgi:hypothetical protein